MGNARRRFARDFVRSGRNSDLPARVIARLNRFSTPAEILNGECDEHGTPGDAAHDLHSRFGADRYTVNEAQIAEQEQDAPEHDPWPTRGFAPPDRFKPADESVDKPPPGGGCNQPGGELRDARSWNVSAKHEP